MSVRVLVGFLAICLLAGIWVAGNEVVRADGFSEDRHGDTMATATDLPFGTENAMLYNRDSGVIYPAGDIDYFRLTVTSEEAGYVYLRFRELADQSEWMSYANVVLLTETGECVVYKCDSDLTERSVVYLKEGVYYLKVSAVEGNGQPDSLVARRSYVVAWVRNSLTEVLNVCVDIETFADDPLFGVPEEFVERRTP